MLIETLIFYSYKCMLQIFRYLVNCYICPVSSCRRKRLYFILI